MLRSSAVLANARRVTRHYVCVYNAGDAQSHTSETEQPVAAGHYPRALPASLLNHELVGYEPVYSRISQRRK
ncbi:MAG: hypothetical protein ACI8XW_002272 [Gammaproteobacteria bacterium]|jgi:hypothetical protein